MKHQHDVRRRFHKETKDQNGNVGTNKKWHSEDFTQKQNERTGKDSHTNWKKLDELQELKRNVQEQMLENEKSGEEVKVWGYEMESKFENFEQVKEELDQAILRVKQNKIDTKKLRKKISNWGKESKKS